MRALLLSLAIVASVGVAAPVAHADGLMIPREAPGGKAPAGFSVSPGRAVAIASGTGKVREEIARDGTVPLTAHPYLFGDDYWLVRFNRGPEQRVEVQLNGRTGRVTGAWSGREIGWPPIAHGWHGPRSRMLHKLMVLAGLLFLLPFLDFRRPFRLLHLDLLMILALGVSYVFAARGNVYASTPLVYPPLLYLLARLATKAVRGSPDPGRLTWMSWGALAAGLVGLLALRYIYVAVAGEVTDVGFASMFGADSILNGFPIYDSSAGSGHLDSYGPINYLAYVPFVAVFGFDLTHSDVAAGEIAAVAFDLLTVVGLYVLGNRLRPGSQGRVLGLLLAWGYAACPWTLFALASATNDGLVAMLLVWTLVVVATPWARGLGLALASLTKFAPLVLGGLFLRVGRERGLRPMLVYIGTFSAAVALFVLAYLPDGGLRETYDSTIGFQFGRTSPFSLWGLHPSLDPLHTLFTVFAAGMALVAIWLPREREPARLAAFGGALLIAAQITAIHWYYFYIPWFLPYALAGLLAIRPATPAPAIVGEEPQPELAVSRS